MTNESKTLFIPLYGKAVMSREGLWQDKIAEKIVDENAELFTKTDKSKRLAIYMTMRAMQYDKYVERFLENNPNGIIIHLGAGLDSRINRVDAVFKNWYDLDFPEVIALRKDFYSENDSYSMIASSVTDFSWMDKIQYNGEPVLVIAEGLSMYLKEEDIRTLTEQLSAKFNSVTFMFDAYSSFAAKASKIKNPINSVNASISFYMDDEKLFENAETGFKHIETLDIISEEYIDKLKGIYKSRFKFMKRFGSSLYRIYVYQCVK